MPKRLVLAGATIFLALAPAVFATKKPPAQPINIKTADSSQLQLVPGIGPSTAEKILQMRKSYGAFNNQQNVRDVQR
jgi:DNA uptake protein ComE-like DNA-binding protein